MIDVIISDLHVPYHDPKALEVACLTIEYLKPQRIIVAGDRTDFYACSFFDRDPNRILKLQDELDQSFKVGQQINDAAPEGCEIWELVGNHEARWFKYILNHPELTSLRVLTLPSILRHKELGWRIPKGSDRMDLLGGRLRVKHGDLARKYSTLSAKGELEKVKQQISVVMGHTHRQGHIEFSGPRHRVAGMEIGCLCNLEPTWGKDMDWHQGFCVIESHDNPQIHHYQPHLIKITGKSHRRAIVWGKEFYV